MILLLKGRPWEEKSAMALHVFLGQRAINDENQADEDGPVVITEEEPTRLRIRSSSNV